MIPVHPTPEPADFNQSVRIPGQKWLAAHPNAKPSNYQAYWTQALPALEEAFGGRCAYLGHWIPEGHVDHFIAKAVDPSQAYEWSNFRYAEGWVNTKKGSKKFLDPFTVGPDWIDIDPDSLYYFRTDHLPQSEEATADFMLSILNAPKLVRARERLLGMWYAKDKTIPQAMQEHMATFFPLLHRSLASAGLFAPLTDAPTP